MADSIGPLDMHVTLPHLKSKGSVILQMYLSFLWNAVTSCQHTWQCDIDLDVAQPIVLMTH